MNRLASELAEIARSLESEDDRDAMLDNLVAMAVRLIPGAEDASLSMVEGRRTVTSQHQTSEVIVQVDALQTELGKGPCLDAIYEQRTVRVDDLRDDRRWPSFARGASAMGLRSMLSVQLYVEDDNLGALNLCSSQPRAFDDDSEQIALVFASHAAVAFAGARALSHLSQAVESRDLIGQAKGMLMERFSIGSDQAFRVLLRVSQSTHRKIRDVAEELVETGRLAALEQSSSAELRTARTRGPTRPWPSGARPDSEPGGWSSGDSRP